MLINKLLNPKLDYVFKRIFGHVGNESITANLISSVINKEVTSIELDKNTILEKDLLNDKIGILDIRAIINSNIECDIEMQVVNKSNIEKRLLYYWSKLFSKNIVQGENYKILKKTIIILFANYMYTFRCK